MVWCNSDLPNGSDVTLPVTYPYGASKATPFICQSTLISNVIGYDPQKPPNFYQRDGFCYLYFW